MKRRMAHWIILLLLFSMPIGGHLLAQTDAPPPPPITPDNAPTIDEFAQLETDTIITDLAFNPQQSSLLTITTPEGIYIWDFSAGRTFDALPQARISGPPTPVLVGKGVYYTPDGSTLIVISDDTLTLLDASTLEMRVSFDLPLRVEVAQSGLVLVQIGDTIGVLDTATGDIFSNIDAFTITALAVSADGRYIAVADSDGIVRIFTAQPLELSPSSDIVDGRITYTDGLTGITFSITVPAGWLAEAAPDIGGILLGSDEIAFEQISRNDPRFAADQLGVQVSALPDEVRVSFGTSDLDELLDTLTQSLSQNNPALTLGEVELLSLADNLAAARIAASTEGGVGYIYLLESQLSDEEMALFISVAIGAPGTDNLERIEAVLETLTVQ